MFLALGAALAGPKRLVSAKNAPGLFPSAKGGTELAERAVSEGYLVVEQHPIKSGKKTTNVDFGVITEKGIRAFVEQNSPKEAITALLPAVLRLRVMGSPKGELLASCTIE